MLSAGLRVLIRTNINMDVNQYIRNVFVPGLIWLFGRTICYGESGLDPVADGPYTTYLVALLGQRNASYAYTITMTNTGDDVIQNITIEDKTGIVASYANVSFGCNESLYLNDSDYALNGSEVASRTLIVYSNGGPFVLQVFVKDKISGISEGFLGIPIEQMDRPESNIVVYEYVVATFCSNGGFCQFAIAAAENNTHVSITFSGEQPEISFCVGSVKFTTNGTTMITLQKYDAVQFESTLDFTGTHIYSYKPISVFAGSRQRVYTDPSHTIEQLVPSSQWGKRVLVKANLTSSGLSSTAGTLLLKIVSNYDNTHIKLDDSDKEFVITDRHHTIVRLLHVDRGAMLIQANQTIQVIQFNGCLMDFPELTECSMTYVPPLEASTEIPMAYTCYDQPFTFTIVTGESESPGYFDLHATNRDVLRLSYSDVKLTVYTMPPIMSLNVIRLVPNISYTGILTCGNSTRMPMWPLIDNVTVTSQPNTGPSWPTGLCIENQIVTFKESNGRLSTFSGANLALGSDALKLRVKACGSVILEFFGDFNGNVTLIIRNDGIRTLVYNGTQTEENYTTLSKHKDIDMCNGDMTFLWFRQETDDQNEYKLCGGEGPTVSTTCDFTIDIGHNLESFGIRGLFGDAVVIYDVEPLSGCTDYDSDWRCHDRIHNCSAYGKAFCSDVTYGEFAASSCAKHCGLCSSDSFGQVFLFRIPMRNTTEKTDCMVVVSFLNRYTNVAVWSGIKALASKDAGKFSRTYDCLESANQQLPIHIYADNDVSVNVFFQSDIEQILDPLYNPQSFVVYPVDFSGHDFQLVFDTLTYCNPISEYINATGTINYPGGVDSGSGMVQVDGLDVDAGDEFLLASETVITIPEALAVKVQMKFDRPTMLYCISSVDHCVIQYPPKSTWSTEYVIPGVLDSFEDVFYEVRIVPAASASTVFIKESGEKIDITENGRIFNLTQVAVDKSYTLNSSSPIAVGMIVQHHNINRSLQIIPPLSGFLNSGVYVPVSLKALTDMIKPKRMKVHSISSVGGIVAEDVTIPSNHQFYHTSNSTGTSYCFTIFRDEKNKTLIMPGYTTSKHIAKVTEVCKTTRGTVNDNKDNDCDGRIDDDICVTTYGFYYTGNRSYTGDCLKTATGTSEITLPESPTCYESTKPASQCWVPCRCTCKMAEKLAAIKNMSSEELEDAQQEAIQEIKGELFVDTKSLSAEKSHYQSADDKRQSATNLGYVGIGMLAFVFGIIIVIDITSLLRDAKILASNLRDGFGRVVNKIRRRT